MPWTNTTTRSAGFSVTAAVWNSEHVDNMNYFREVNYTAFTGDQTTSATTVGTATTIIATSPASIAYENVPHLIEFYCPSFGYAANSCNIIVKDSSTVLGTIGRTGASGTNFPLYCIWRVTPTAASHSYSIAAWLGGAGTATFNAGTGGTAGDSTTDVAGFIRITRAIPT